MKRLLTFLALLGFSAVSVAAVAHVVRIELKPAEHFDRASLEAWLASHDPEASRFDVADAPVEVRRAARMLEADFQADYDWRPYFRKLDTVAQTRFQRNFLALVRFLFEQRADYYAGLRSYERDPFLDSQLKSFAQWYVFDEQGKRVRGAEMILVGSRLLLAEQADAGDDEERRALRFRQGVDFIRDLQARGLKKATGLLRSGRPPQPKRSD